MVKVLIVILSDQNSMGSGVQISILLGTHQRYVCPMKHSVGDVCSVLHSI